jgi:hypothetical protein
MIRRQRINLTRALISSTKTMLPQWPAGAPVTSNEGPAKSVSACTQMFVVGGMQPTQPLLQKHAAADWMCVCGYVNFSSRQACNQCQRKKEGGDAPAAAPPLSGAGSTVPGSREVLRGDWFCACGAHNFSRRTQCMSCQGPKPVVAAGRSANSRRVLPGDWICTCGSHNFRSRTACLTCGAAAQSAPAAVITAPLADWTCRNCQTPNPAENPACGLCGSPAQSGSAGAPSVLRSGDWTCPQCSFHNFASRQTCKECQAARPEGAQQNPGALAKTVSIAVPKPGDWQCACGCQNFARRVDCFGCGAARK